METATRHFYEKSTDPDVSYKLNDVYSALLKENQTTQIVLSTMLVNLDRKVDTLTEEVAALSSTTKSIETRLDSELTRSTDDKRSSLDIIEKINTRFYWSIIIAIGLAGLVLSVLKH
ncbi:hypothetical protein [Sporomusa malonica]|uniref:Uncharacterized protein n=1 Tax=Sporomusa malonica TaxID=112901 RepID=A0A1W2CST4_9FIRM|nr:hypothetical protein [Sporomusa malonica]SMC88297.1 hypothetical protein SAMN04488500_111131 [Sporomusa malonica]